MQWLANRAQRQREVVDRLMLGHVADLEMALGDRPVIAGDEAVEDVGEETTLLARDAAHDAEIDRDDIAGPGISKEIARMHVGMKEAVADRMLEKRLEQRFTQLLAIEPGRIQRRNLA